MRAELTPFIGSSANGTAVGHGGDYLAALEVDLNLLPRVCHLRKESHHGGRIGISALDTRVDYVSRIEDKRVPKDTPERTCLRPIHNAPAATIAHGTRVASFISYHRTATIKDGTLESGKGTWGFTGASGKLQGIKGKALTSVGRRVTVLPAMSTEDINSRNSAGSLSLHACPGPDCNGAQHPTDPQLLVGQVRLGWKVKPKNLVPETRTV